jgi:hypothetical protein
MSVDERLLRALAAAARAFAEELEQGLPRPDQAPKGVLAGSAVSMLEVLGSIARINDAQGRGASDDEVRIIARRVGMDPRGMAGYYSAGFLEKRVDGRWLSTEGRERMVRLEALSSVVIPGPSRSETAVAGAPDPQSPAPSDA